MNRKHSFAVRCLALVLALVMILSNANLGLTMHAQAAEETSSLFELIANSESVGTKELNAILAYEAALDKLNDETIKYETAPEKADALLRQDTLAVNAIGAWVPYTYTVNGETKEFNGTYTVALPKDTVEATVNYKLDLNKDAEVKAAMEYIAWLADEAGQQDAALAGVSGGTSMAALMMLNESFTDELIDAVGALTLEDVGIDVDALVDEKVGEILDELLAGKLTGDAEIDAEIRAKAEEEAKKEAEKVATEEAEKELAAVKADYIATLETLKDRMVEPGTSYANLAKKYVGKLTIYAMLSEYKKDGLAHFYLKGQEIIDEMTELGVTLYAILGEQDEAGVYANANIIDALIAEMGYEGTVSAVELGIMADRMANGAVTLGKYTSYQEINAEGDVLIELAKALAKCGTVAEYNTDLCLYSKNFEVLDDSWKYVNVALAGTEVTVNHKVETDAVLTEEDVAAIKAEIAVKAKHYDVDTTAVDALVGTKMVENVAVECPAVVKEYDLKVFYLDGTVGTMKVSGDAATITLTVTEGHITSYVVGGTQYDLAFNGITEATIPVNMDDIASGALVVEVVADQDMYKDILIGAITNINNALGREALVLTEEFGTYTALTADIEMAELMVIAQEFIMNDELVSFADGSRVKLNNEPFVVNDGGVAVINVQALINAMMSDPTFSNEKLIAMGYGQTNNLLTAKMQLPGYDMVFKMNLTTVPAEMADVASALDAVKEFFWFKSNDAEDVLDVFVDLPEKVYEAYATTFIASGYMDDDNLNLSNEIAMNFVADYVGYIMDMNIDENTFNNTLKAMHMDKDVSAYYNYFATLRSVLKSENFQYSISEQVVDFTMTGDKYDILDLLGMDDMSGMLGMGMNFLSEEPITGKVVVNLVNAAPDYQALVIEPGKANDAGIANKLNVVDYTENLVAKAPTIGTVASVMLLDDINGNLTFNGNVILDLNGKTINGSVIVNGKAVVIDSNLATYNGGTITGSFSANGGMILGGTFGNDISAFLRDGYIQDKGAVRNAMYYIDGNGSNYTYVLNADFYQLCDGYLPSVEALAVDIATDMALNAFPTVGMAYDGKSMYGLNLDNLLNSYLGNSFGGAFDAMMTDLTTYINVEGINALANDIIDDLTNIQAMSDALNNNTVIGRMYKFTSYPAGVKFVHNEESNTLDIGFVANTKYPKNFSIGMKIEGNNRYYESAKNLLSAMAEVFFIDAEVHLQQPTWYAASNKLTVGGGASVDFVLDLSKDSDYTRAIAIILAYGNPEDAAALIATKGCVKQLNPIIGEMTVEDVFSALKAMNRNITITEMADAVGYTYGTEEIARLEAAYHTILCGMGKVLEVLDVTGNDTKMSFLADGKADVTVDAYNKVIDASVMGFTGVAELEFARFSFTFKMAPNCTGLMGDVNWDGVVDTDDAAWICYYDAELIGDADLHLCVGDVTGDGFVDSDDAAWICYYDAELIEYKEFPCFTK